MPYVAAIALSAFLLFSLELLAGRLLLPVFGGSPQVWTTALVFFTGALLIGYAYAHWIATRASRATGLRIQLALVVTAVVLTALAPSDVASTRVAHLPEAANVLFALALVSGPAAFVLATTTPLLSAWYAGTGRDPWWLYAASNAASFVGLISYPLLVQPLVGLGAQRGLLVAGLVAYGGLIAATALRRPRDRAETARAEPAPPATPPRLSVRRQAVWLLTAAVPAGLLSATTNFITTDVVAAPLLWIGPLGAYLASFVVAFSRRGAALVRWSRAVAPGAVLLLLVPFAVPIGWPLLPLIVAELAGFFVLAVAIHGSLAGDRPDERQLTRFYLVLSTGGVLGTAFVALIAPLLFDAIYEYPLLVVAAPVALALLVNRRARSLDSTRERLLDPKRLVVRVAAFAAAAAVLWGALYLQDAAIALPVGAMFVIAAALVALSVTPAATAVAAAGFFALLFAATNSNPIHRERTFFGVLEVHGTEVQHSLYSGTTLHGLQYLDDRRGLATAYYLPTGPLGDCFTDLRTRDGGAEAHIAMVGLGAGVMATYLQPTDDASFIEIDSAGAAIARDPAYFTFLRDAAVTPDIVIGDGRLALADVPPASYDLVVLDAFSSDAVPAHLLTAEALRTYADALRPRGVVCFHLSNRHYELSPSVASTARHIGLEALERVGVPSEAERELQGAQVSVWLVVGTPADVRRFQDRGWTAPEPGLVFTDDYSDLTRLLIGGLREP